MAFKPSNKKKDDRNKNRNLFKRRKFCRFSAEKIPYVDYKDVELLKDFVTERSCRLGEYACYSAGNGVD